MTESIFPPPPAPSPETRPSLPSWATGTLALLTALGSFATAWHNDSSARDTLKAAYEALERADEDKSRQLAELARGQEELRAWVSELSSRLDQRTTNTEKTLRKVVKPKTALPPPPPPPPPAPPTLDVRPSTPLPSFDQLEK